MVQAGELEVGLSHIGRRGRLRDAEHLVVVHEPIVRTADGPWEVMGAGSATVYRKGVQPKTATNGATIELGAVPTSR